MLTLFLALPALLLAAVLLRWWWRGGVVPAIMLTVPACAMLPVVLVGLHDVPGPHNALLGLLYVGGPLALAWAPRWLRRAGPTLPAPPLPRTVAACPPPLDRSERLIVRNAGVVGLLLLAFLIACAAST